MQKNGENDRNTQKIGHRCPKKRVLGKIKLRDFQYILMTPIQGNIMQKNEIQRHFFRADFIIVPPIISGLRMELHLSHGLKH